VLGAVPVKRTKRTKPRERIIAQAISHGTSVPQTPVTVIYERPPPPKPSAYLGNEGINVRNVHLVGNTMIDTLKACLGRLDAGVARTAMGLNGRYMVATLHLPANVDNPGSLKQLVAALHEVADKTDIIIPMHLRGSLQRRRAGQSPWHPHLRPAGCDGDATVLAEYGQHARIRGDDPERTIDAAATAYLALTTAGTDALLRRAVATLAGHWSSPAGCCALPA
jgi:hypothetical protein